MFGFVSGENHSLRTIKLKGSVIWSGITAKYLGNVVRGDARRQRLRAMPNEAEAYVSLTRSGGDI